MDLTILNRESKVTPMLVRLYDTHKLYSLAKDKKPLARTELCSAICELLDISASDREAELIADVLVGLMRQAEKDLKAALSERMSVMENIPLRLALHMANDEIEIAAPMLTKSAVLGDLDLIYIIKSKTCEYWRAIAARKSMSDNVVNVLAETRETKTMQTLLDNNNIILPQLALNTIATMAEDSEILAMPLLRRPEVTVNIASRLYNFVGQELKNYIAQNYHLDNRAVFSIVDEVVVEFKQTGASEFTPSNAMVNAAERYKSKDLLNVNLMMGTLRRGQIQSFIAQLSVYANMPVRYVEESLKEERGTNLAILCKACDIVKADFVTIFLLTNRVRQRGRMVDVSEMTRAVSTYNKFTRDQANELLRAAMRKK